MAQASKVSPPLDVRRLVAHLVLSPVVANEQRCYSNPLWTSWIAACGAAAAADQAGTRTRTVLTEVSRVLVADHGDGRGVRAGGHHPVAADTSGHPAGPDAGEQVKVGFVLGEHDRSFGEGRDLGADVGVDAVVVGVAFGEPRLAA